MADALRDPYHVVHYGLAHTVLPTMVLGDALTGVLEQFQAGGLPRMLSQMWNQLLEIDMSGLSERERRELGTTEHDFACHGVMWENDPAGWVGMMLTMPPVRGPLEASHVVCAVRTAGEDSGPGVRYFTCEAPARGALVWMMGEVHGVRQRSNLGPLPGPDPVAMVASVGRALRVSGTPVMSAVTSGAGPQPVPEQVMTESNEIGKLRFRSSWKSSPTEIAGELLLTMNGVIAAGGAALVLSAERANGLGKKVSSYLQVMNLPSGELLLEVQSDYSYWGLEISARGATTLRSAGFADRQGTGNYWLRVQPGLSHDAQLAVVTRAVDAFLQVLQPRGKIRARAF